MTFKGSSMESVLQYSTWEMEHKWLQAVLSGPQKDATSAQNKIVKKSAWPQLPAAFRIGSSEGSLKLYTGATLSRTKDENLGILNFARVELKPVLSHPDSLSPPKERTSTALLNLGQWCKTGYHQHTEDISPMTSDDLTQWLLVDGKQEWGEHQALKDLPTTPPHKTD